MAACLEVEGDPEVGTLPSRFLGCRVEVRGMLCAFWDGRRESE